MEREFEDILNECIERVVRQGEAIEQCLAAYPQQAAELEPLLQVALASAHASAIVPRPGFKDALSSRLVSASPSRPKGGWFLSWGWGWGWVGAVVGIMALFLVVIGAVAASAGSLPGEPLYAVKMATEEVRLRLARSPVDKARLHIGLGERRVQEIAELGQRGQAEEVAKLTQRLSHHLQQAATVEQAGEKAGELQHRLEQSSAQQLALLEQALEKVPEAVKPALEQALTVSGEGYGAAIETAAHNAPVTVPVAVAMGTLQIRATDPPPPQVDQVLVEVSNIQVRKAGKDGRWITVLSEPATFDLIKVAEVQKLLSSRLVEAGTYTQVRLEVTKTTVVVGEEEYPARVPSGKLKLVRPFRVKEGEPTVVLLDFDGQRSLKLTGAGEYVLKPTVKLLVPQAGKESRLSARGKKTKVEIEGTIESITQTDSGTVIVVQGQEVVLPPGTGIAGILQKGMAIEVETVAQPDGSFLVTEIEAEGEDGTKVELKGTDLEMHGTIDSITQTESGTEVVVAGQKVVLGPDTEIKGILEEGMAVKLEAVLQPDGSFLVTEIKAEEEDEREAEKEARELKREQAKAEREVEKEAREAERAEAKAEQPSGKSKEESEEGGKDEEEQEEEEQAEES